MAVIPAAGTVPWRHVHGALQVALVHRPRYDDWSWPKGKLDPGESWVEAAVRETREETGLQVQLGVPLPGADYTVLDRDGSPATKEVRYWAAEVVGGKGRLVNEIDEVAWLEVQAAYLRLDYARDRDQLFAVVRAHQEGRLATRPLAVVRHAKALPRSAYKGANDQLRPLEKPGERRSADLVGLLAAYGVDRLISSPSRRCVDTLRPYAVVLGKAVRARAGLSEEGHDAVPAAAAEVTLRELHRDRATAVCSHGPVLPGMLTVLAEHAPADHPEIRRLILKAATDAMAKGEVLLAHVTRAGEPVVVAVERHQP